MNQTQLRNLQKLVDGDFNNLRSQVGNHIQRLYDQRLRELGTGDSGLPTHIRTKVAMVEAECRNKLDRLRDELATMGWTTAKSGGYNDAFDFKINYGYLSNKSFDQRRSELSSARARILAQAGAVVTRHHLQVNRAILLQGITGTGAADILNNLPDENKVMTSITNQLEGYEEDLALLNGSDQN